MRTPDGRKATPVGESPGDGRRRRDYAPPKLTEWGNIHTLTRGGNGPVVDLPVSMTRKDT